MTSKNFQQNMVNQNQEIIFEVVKVSGNWAFPAAKSIVEATRGKNMYLRLTDDGKSDIFRLDFVKDGENSGETVFGFVGNGGMDLVELTATTDGTGATTGSWEYEPGEGPAGEAIGNLGQPLQWKGPATVAQLNAGITGIKEGWTYTLTNAGTLTDGSIKVEIDDEVAWTGTAWFKVGSETAKVKILYGSSGNPPAITFTDMIATISRGYYVILDISDTFYPFVGSNNLKPVFSNGTDKYTLGIDNTWSKTSVDYVEVFQVAYDSDLGDFVWPTYNDINTVVTEKKSVCIVQTTPGGAKHTYWLDFKSTSSGNMFFRFVQGDGSYIQIHQNGTVDLGNLVAKDTAIAPEYDATSTYDVDDVVMQGGLRYVCNTAITVAEEWDNSHWTLQSVQTAMDSLGSDVEIVNVGDYAPNTSALFDYLVSLYNAGKTAILRYSYAMYNSDYIMGYGIGWSPYGSIASIKAFSNVYEDTVNILTIDSSGYSFEQKYIGRLTELTDATESDLDSGNSISMGHNVVRKLTLTTISTLTVNIGSVGNFALEIDNTGNSNDVTVDVVRNSTSLKYSVSGGNTVGAGKYMQLTCVGSCWTLAEFTVPTP